MDKEIIDKIKEYETAAGSEDGMKAFWERMDLLLTTEVNQMQDMSREELINYAAATRLFLVELQNQVNIYAEAMQVMQTRQNLQAKNIDLLAFAVNNIIDKKKIRKI